MALTWGSIKQLVRLQGVAEQFGAMARGGDEGAEWRDVEWGLAGVLEELVNEVHGTLVADDPALAQEFERIVMETSGARVSLNARAAILIGWLRGAVEAETLELRIRVGDERTRGPKVAPRTRVET
ncbi:MAG TPA: hypothetical protein VGJ49_08960 [Gaiellaceae bacterium]|jgi:hypothetical protein